MLIPRGKTIIRRQAVDALQHPQYLKCIGCDEDVQPQFAYHGSVLQGLAWLTRQSVEVTPVEMVEDTPQHFTMRGGDVVEFTRRFPYMKRVKGFICSDCAANYKGLTDKQGVFHPFIKTDSRVMDENGVSIGVLPAHDERRVTSRRPAFNTRVTQGRKGVRV